MRTTPGFRFGLAWVVGSFCAVVMAMIPLPAAFVDGHYIPVGNDSFYHARRILDAAADPAGFYEFDPKIHAPEGSMVTWPWAYDSLLATVVRGMLATGLASDPMKVLDYAPVFAILISVALVVGIAIALELPWLGALLLTLSVAFSPLTQSVHGVGNIDHHYVEYIFVLATLFCGLQWLRAPPSRYWAGATAAVMGVAPAFHAGLFIVQVPLLLACAVLWLRGVRLPRAAALTFAGVMVTAALAAALPSLPFRQGSFEFYYLSWFHCYVACCTAGLIATSSLVAASRKSALAIACCAALAAVPLISQTLVAASFVTGQLGVLPDIAEVQGVLQLAVGRGIAWTTGVYSLLIFVAPVALIGCVWVVLRRQSEAPLLLACVYCVCGLLLLFLQFRLHVYGSLALVLPWVLLACRLEVRSPERRRVLIGATAGAFAVAYLPAVKDQLFAQRVPGNDPYYAVTRDIYPAMAQACEARPGIVLAGRDAGHYIRFHTQCSVIADNFLITPQHIEKDLQVRKMMSLTPQQLLADGPPVQYIYVSLADVAAANPGKNVVLPSREHLAEVQPRLVGALLFGDPQSLDPRLRLVKELPYSSSVPLARLFAVTAVAAPRSSAP